MTRALRIVVLLASITAGLSHAQVAVLPGGFAPVSELTVQGSDLALDSNGALYRSEDGGKHWHQVKQQWDGRAVELLGIPALTTAPGSG